MQIALKRVNSWKKIFQKRREDEYYESDDTTIERSPQNSEVSEHSIPAPVPPRPERHGGRKRKRKKKRSRRRSEHHRERGGEMDGGDGDDDEGDAGVNNLDGEEPREVLRERGAIDDEVESKGRDSGEGPQEDPIPPKRVSKEVAHVNTAKEERRDHRRKKKEEGPRKEEDPREEKKKHRKRKKGERRRSERFNLESPPEDEGGDSGDKKKTLEQEAAPANTNHPVMSYGPYPNPRYNVGGQRVYAPSAVYMQPPMRVALGSANVPYAAAGGTAPPPGMLPRPFTVHGTPSVSARPYAQFAPGSAPVRMPHMPAGTPHSFRSAPVAPIAAALNAKLASSMNGSTSASDVNLRYPMSTVREGEEGPYTNVLEPQRHGGRTSAMRRRAHSATGGLGGYYGPDARRVPQGAVPVRQAGAMQAGVMGSGVMHSGVMQPGMMQPGMMQSGMMQPGIMQPGMMQPGMVQPGMVQPGMVQPGMVRSGVMQTGAMGYLPPPLRQMSPTALGAGETESSSDESPPRPRGRASQGKEEDNPDDGGFRRRTHSKQSTHSQRSSHSREQNRKGESEEGSCRDSESNDLESHGAKGKSKDLRKRSNSRYNGKRHPPESHKHGDREGSDQSSSRHSAKQHGRRSSKSYVEEWVEEGAMSRKDKKSHRVDAARRRRTKSDPHMKSVHDGKGGKAASSNHSEESPSHRNEEEFDDDYSDMDQEELAEETGRVTGKKGAQPLRRRDHGRRYGRPHKESTISSRAEELDELRSRRAKSAMRNAGFMGRVIPKHNIPSPKRGAKAAKEHGFFEDLPDLEEESMPDHRLERQTKTGSFWVEVPQGCCYIVERFGKYKKKLDAGWHLLVPIVEKIKYVHSLREEALPIPPQQACTRDNVNMHVSAVLFIQVADPVSASYAIDNPYRSVMIFAQTCIRTAVGKLTVEEVQDERSELSEEIGEAISDRARGWGLRCTHFEIRDIDLPDGILMSGDTFGDALANIDEDAVAEAQYLDDDDSEYSREKEAEELQGRADALLLAIKRVKRAMDDPQQDSEHQKRLARQYLLEYNEIARKANDAYERKEREKLDASIGDWRKNGSRKNSSRFGSGQDSEMPYYKGRPAMGRQHQGQQDSDRVPMPLPVGDEATVRFQPSQSTFLDPVHPPPPPVSFN